MTPDMEAAAINAVTQTDPNGPGGLRIQAVRELRIATGCGLRDAIVAVDKAMDQRRTFLTRADKERAVAEMAKGLAAISENYVYAASFPDAFKPGSAKWFARKQELMRKAIVRMAMARTVD